MADDERRSETFIREVDEELRRDQLKQLWMRFAPVVIGVCILVVAVTGGYRGWLWWQDRQAAQAGDRFLSAIEQIQNGNTEEGEAALDAIAKDGGTGYAALAQLRLAGEKAAAGDKAGALAAFDALTNEKSVAEPLRDLARIRAALLALDTGDLEGAKTRAQPLNVSGNPWRHAAREVLGTVAYQQGDLQNARVIFSDIQQDAQTPPDLWIRAGLIVSLIDGQLAAPAPAPASDGSTEQTPAAGGDAGSEQAPADASSN